VKHTGPIAGIAAKGPYVATAGYDNQLILWQADGKRALARSLHDHLINNCAFSSSGEMIVSASSDYSARIWEVPSLRLKAALLGHQDDVDMAVFSPDDRKVATCALDRTIRIFDTTGQCLRVLEGHAGNIKALAWTADGLALVSSSVDGTVRQWDASTGQEISCTRLGVRTDTLVIAAEGRIFAGDDRGRIIVIGEGEPVFIQAHQAGVKKVSFDAASETLVTLSYDRTIAIWKVAGAQVSELGRSELPPTVWARAATVIGPSQLAVGTFGASYGVFDWQTQTWHMDGVAAGGALNAVAMVDADCYAIGDAGVLTRNGQPAALMGSLCNFLIAEGGRLFTGGQMGVLFDARTGEELFQHRSPLNCAASFRRHGRAHLVVGTYTGEALVFDLEDGDSPRLVQTLAIYQNAIKGLAASGDRLFSVCASTDVAWHDLDDFRLIRTVRKAHEKIANACCVAGANGFASVGRDRKLRLWLDDEEEVYQTPHPNSVKCICASDDKLTLMTGAYTGTLAAFDVPTRSWTCFGRPTASGISALAFDRKRRRFQASSFDGQVHDVA
jgi:toxoflavin biosynthesis protein ToxC